MPEHTGNEPGHTVGIDDVIVEFIRSEEAGESVDRNALLARYPQFADELRQYFADREQFQRIAPLAPPPSTAFRPSLEKLHYFGDYELIEEIARGGMGIVYKARQVSLNRIVAVKMILAGHLASDEDIKRFQTEAEAAANLQHPNIVAVHEVGIHEGQHYFSMDFVDGSSLAEMIRESPLPADKAARYVKSVADAVHHAHQQGTLHRDLKPSNVLIDSNDNVRITDFGLASRVTDDSDLTRTGQALGTPAYMPPEQATGQRDQIGSTSDVYSLGAILYELLTGRPPFRAETPVETIRQVLDNEPVSPRLLNPALPRDLETVCLKCLEKQPSNRYKSSAQLAKDLQRFLSGEPILARPVRRTERTWRWCKRNPVVAGLTVAVFASLIIGTYISTHLAVVANKRAVLAQQREKEALWNSYVASLNAMVRPFERREYGRLYQILEQLVPAEGEPDFRGWEWYFLQNQCRRRMTVLPVTKCDLASIAWSPNGEQLATAGRVIELWDHTAERLIRRFGTDEDATAVAWSPTGGLLAVGSSDGKICLWDPLTGKRVTTYVAHDEEVTSLSWSPDGRQLASSGSIDDGAIHIWRVENSNVTKSQTLREEPFMHVWQIDWHPHDSRLAAAFGRSGFVNVWDTSTGSVVFAKQAGDSLSWNVAWSPDGDYLAVGGGFPKFAVMILDEAGNELTQLVGHDSVVRSVCWSPDGREIATGGTDHKIKIWGRDGHELEKVQIHAGAVERLQWHPNGIGIASAGSDSTVKVWKTKIPHESSEVLIEQSEWVDRVACSPNAKWMAGAVDKRTVVIWKADSGKTVHTLAGHPGNVHAVTWSPDSRRIAAVCDKGDIYVWDGMTGNKVLSFPTLSREHIAWSPNGKMLASGGAGLFQIWDAKTGHSMATIREPAWSLAWSPGSELLATGGIDDELRVWDAATWDLLLELDCRAIIFDIAWRPSGGVLAVATKRSQVLFIDVATGEEIHTLRGHNHAVERFAWSSDGRRIATGGFDGVIKIWDALTLEELFTLQHHEHPIKGLDWCANSQRLVSASAAVRSGAEGVVRVWNAGEPINAPARAETVETAILGLGKTPADAEQILRSRAALRPSSVPTVELGATYESQGELASIDLSAWANHTLDEVFSGIPREGNHLSLLPRGEQTFIGVHFEIRDGILQIGANRKDAPPCVTGITINDAFAKLHILHGVGDVTSSKSLVNGDCIAKYRVVYEDHTEAIIPVIFGEDVRDWWCNDSFPVSRGRIAWIGDNVAAAEFGFRIRVYLTTWQNPYPEKRVSCIDYVATKDVAPFCVAMTLERADASNGPQTK